MKTRYGILFLLLLAFSACHTPTHEARRMVARAERLFDSLPDSTVRLIDSVLRMPVYFNERRRMDMALLQAEALFGCRDVSPNASTLSSIMDDDFFDDHGNISTSPELEHAAAYYARKKQYAKAAHAALYSGFVQQYYDEKENATHSFKDAEHYGGLVGDSLTVAQAQYKIGRLLYYDGMKQEALNILKCSEQNFGNHNVEKILVQNMIGACYMLQGNLENAETYLQQSLINAKKSYIEKVTQKVLNNYSVLCRLQGKQDLAIDYLRQMVKENDLNETDRFVYFLNLFKAFMATSMNDSAALYYQRIENLLPTVRLKNEAKVSAYEALSHFAEVQDNYPLALHYHKRIKETMSTIIFQRQNQNVYRIQKQYNYEALQNSLNRKIILRHRIILIISILLLVLAVVILFLQYRRKQLLKAEEIMKWQIDAMKQDLRQTIKTSVMDEEIVLRLRMMLTANRTKKRVKDPQNEWLSLVLQVMNGKEDLFEAARSIIEKAYPNLYSIIVQKYPNLTDTEAKICLLSFCNISNAEMAELLGLRLNTVNQSRSVLRKKLNLKSEKMKEQLRIVLTNEA